MWTFLASKPVLCLLFAAFVLRTGMAVAVQTLLDHHWKRQFVIAGDAQGYWWLGQALAEGEEYAAYEPPRYVLRMPGFPLLLALPIRLTDSNFLAVRLFLAGLGTVACGFVYLLGRELFDKRIGLLAGWFTAVSPALVGFSVMILSETPFALGILGSLWGMACLLRKVSEENSLSNILGWAAITGGFIAVATYMRPSWLPVAGLCPLGLILRERSRTSVLAGGLILGTVVLALLPWAIRNRQVTGHWVITTLWSGPSLYDGLHPEATGASDMKFLDRENLRSRMTEYEVNQTYWQRGMDYARHHPGRAVELAFIKLWRFWKPWPSAKEAGNWLSRSVIAAFSLLLYLGVLYGIWLYRRDGTVLALTIGPVLYFSVLHAIFVGSLRYRLPAEYPLATLAAIGWWQFYQNRFADPHRRGDSPC